MKNLRKTGLAALLLAVSLGGYAVCMENVQAAGEDVELEMEEFSDEQELTTEDQNTSEEEIAADLSGDQMMKMPELIRIQKVESVTKILQKQRNLVSVAQKTAT